MKRNLNWLFFVAVCLLCVTIGWTVNAQRSKTKQPPLATPASPQATATIPTAPATPKAQWEYKIVSESERPVFNDLGAQGWELVAVTNGGAEEVYFFKRAK